MLIWNIILMIPNNIKNCIYYKLIDEWNFHNQLTYKICILTLITKQK